MKPLTLTLPDEVRDAFEDACDQQDLRVENQQAKARATQLVAKLLFDKNNNDPWQNKFREHLIGMQTGHSSPVIYVQNLPHRHGSLFAYALAKIMDNDVREKLTNFTNIRSRNKLNFHQDKSYYGRSSGKLIPTLYYANISEQLQRTIFITADEIIHAHVCKTMGLPIDTPINDPATEDNEAYNLIREHYIEELRGVTITHYIISATNIKDDNALLQRNPNYQRDSGAPEFFICGANGEMGDLAVSDDRQRALKDEFYETAAELLERAAQESLAGTEPHSMAIWNDPMVLHARTELQESHNKAALRDVHCFDASPSTIEYSPVSYATTGPYTRVDLSSHPEWQSNIAAVSPGRDL